MKAAIYGLSKDGLNGSRGDRGDRIGLSMADGLKKRGIEYSLHTKFDGVCADVALAYGWIHELQEGLFTKYKEAGKHFVFFDLGYWNRGQKGSYRVAIDDWDSARHFPHDSSDFRFRASGITLRNDWKPTSKNVIIAGMSDKAAWTHGFKFMEWENKTRAYLSGKYEGMGFKFAIRAKPKNKDKDKVAPIEDLLKHTYCVVSHHSNVSVDAIIAGVPFTCRKGVARHVAPPGLPDDFVEDLDLLAPHVLTYDQRYNFLCNVAYVQWTTKEMSEGHCWDYIQGVLKSCA